MYNRIIEIGVPILIGGILGLYFYLKSLVRIVPYLNYGSRTEISKLSSNNKNIKLLYKEKEVERVTITLITFENKGRRPILPSDVVESAPLRLRLSDTENNIKILDYSIHKVNRESSGIGVILDPDDSFRIVFKFIDKSDGISFRVQHTGGYNTKVSLEGIILGPQAKLKIINSSNSVRKFHLG